MQFVLSVKITGLVSTVPGLAVGPVLVPLIRPYMYCLLVSLTPFHHFFLTYLLPFPMRIDPLHYHRPDVVKERLNMALVFCVYFTIRYDTRCYFNVRSKADISQLNLPHGTDN